MLYKINALFIISSWTYNTHSCYRTRHTQDTEPKGAHTHTTEPDTYIHAIDPHTHTLSLSLQNQTDTHACNSTKVRQTHTTEPGTDTKEPGTHTYATEQETTTHTYATEPETHAHTRARHPYITEQDTYTL